MRKALLAVAGAALMGAILVAPACSEVGRTFSATAIADFSEAIRLNPKDAVAYNNRGVAYYAKSDLDRAIADFNEAIRLDPKDAIAYNNRGAARGAEVVPGHHRPPDHHRRQPVARSQGRLFL